VILILDKVERAASLVECFLSNNSNNSNNLEINIQEERIWNMWAMMVSIMTPKSSEIDRKIISFDYFIILL